MATFSCKFIFMIVSILFVKYQNVECIQCYQCSSADGPLGEDNCGVYSKFDKTKHIAVDCNSDEAYAPGSFCKKIVQQSPRGFIWNGRWRQVIRECASVADTGVTGVCNWGVYDNGIFWEECYCSEDGCNGSSYLSVSFINLLISLGFLSLINALLTN